MNAIAERLLTANEFADLPPLADGLRQELVRGVVVTMSPARAIHGTICLEIAWLLRNYAAKHGGRGFSNDTSVLTQTAPDTVRGPDLGYWRKDPLSTLPKNGIIEVPADLLVEVASPSNDQEDLHEKAVEYLAMGVRMVWIVYPESRTVEVFRQPHEGKVLLEEATLTGEDVLPDFSVPVKNLFPPK